MFELTIKDKTYQIKYAYRPTTAEAIIPRFVKKISKKNKEAIDGIQDVLEIIPELLLIGLQKFHKDEFGYDYISKEGKEEKMVLVEELLDDYFDEGEGGLIDIFEKIQTELMEDGFLSSLFREEMAKNEKK